jgi:hypothetical protein
MKATKQLIVCLTVCLVASFVSIAYAASLELRGSAPVTVVNPNTKPIPVTEVNKYPFQKEDVIDFNKLIAPWLAYENIYEVPADKRLVIEYFSCRSIGGYSTSYSCCIETGQYPGVEHCLPSTPYGHPFIPIAVNPDGTGDGARNFPARMSAGQVVKIYADPGTLVYVYAYRQIQGLLHWEDYPEERMQFSFSGYLEDIPQ